MDDLNSVTGNVNKTNEELKNENENKTNTNLLISSNVDVPKLSQNAQKLKDMEEKMLSLEATIFDVKETLTKNKESKLKTKEEISKIHQESKEIYNKFNHNLSDRIKKTFIKDFDLASKQVVEHEDKRKLMEDKNYEFENLISELDNTNFEYLITNRKLEEQYSDLKGEYEYLKEGYDELIKENSDLKNDNIKKDEKINLLETELKDMKNVISKLTEIRVILNKYFSSHFENFTPQEKKIIQEVQGPIQHDNRYQGIGNNIHNQSINASQNYENKNNVKSREDSGNSRRKENINNNQIKILNEDEYKKFQQNKKSININENENSIKKSQKINLEKSEDNYHPDDDFWYQGKAKR